MVSSHTLYLALTEVIPSTTSSHAHMFSAQSVYVNPREDSVILRFLFAYPSDTGCSDDNGIPSISVNTLRQVSLSLLTVFFSSLLPPPPMN